MVLPGQDGFRSTGLYVQPVDILDRAVINADFKVLMNLINDLKFELQHTRTELTLTQAKFAVLESKLAAINPKPPHGYRQS